MTAGWKKTARSAFVTAPAGLVIAGLILAWWPGGLMLEVLPVEGGSRLLGLPMRPGEEFTLHYIHSVDQEPIWEVHSVGPDGTIYIEEEILVMFGAGMGELPGRGRLTGRGDLQVIEDMHDAIGEFVLRVGRPGVDHTIWWRDEKFNLTRIAAGRAVRVRARQINLLHRIALALRGPRIAPGLDEK